MSYEERVAQPCIGRDRADLVIGGCALLDAICRTWPVGRLRVADRGLREGILIKLIGHPEGGHPESGAAPAERADRLG
jgi:exopolyphosphatase/guanosine-5'-triphosphate,3'-diphosphate pyrophosphatase